LEIEGSFKGFVPVLGDFSFDLRRGEEDVVCRGKKEEGEGSRYLEGWEGEKLLLRKVFGDCYWNLSIWKVECRHICEVQTFISRREVFVEELGRPEHVLYY
jgi:hypothetical protein